jgi:hypothetical protein
VATSIDIPAPPQQVWQTVLQPTRLTAPSQLLFRAGVAYPLASRIEGAGPSAIRYCDFSTGKLVEPVLIWDEGRRLRFTVRSNPLPMQEWTPYARLHPPHMDGFLVSRQGEFRLEALPDGRTRLIATTWYQDHLYPASYWRLWSDYIIHQVHKMVLENVRERAIETSLQKDVSFEEPHSLAADDHAIATILAPDLAAARRNLERAKLLLAEAFGPSRDQRAVGRTRDRIFEDAFGWREKPRYEISFASGRRGNDGEAIDSHQCGHVRAQ